MRHHTDDSGGSRSANATALSTAIARGDRPPWGRIGWLSFGGPAGQIALMHRILVDEEQWVSEARFLHALNYCMLLPGPEAQQLATYLGWLLGGVRGGLRAGLLFILPGVLALYALSLAYVELGDVGPVAGALFGLKCAVLALVVQAVVRVGKRALKTPAMVGLALAALLALTLFAVPFPLVIAFAAVIGVIGHGLVPGSFVAAAHGPARASGPIDDAALAGSAHTRPSAARAVRTAALWLAIWWLPIGLLRLGFGADHVLVTEAIFFSKTAVVTFGGAYAVLAYLGQQAVGHYHWLLPREMLTGLGMAETTPGPLIMVLQFVGFVAAYRSPGGLPPLVAASLGAAVAVWTTFAPCFLWIFVGAPYVEALRGRPWLDAALSAITAAVVGVIANLALWFTIALCFRTVRSWRGPLGIALPVPELASVQLAAIGLALGAILLTFWARRGTLTTLGLTAAAGVLVYFAGLG